VEGDDVDAGDPPDPPPPTIDAAVPDDLDAAPVDVPDAAPGEPDAEPADAGELPPTSFTADIFPRLQSTGDLALGCQQCHTSAGIADEFPYDDGLETVYARIMNQAGVVDLANPTNSLLLRRPLGENHPVRLFDDVDDPGTADDANFAAYSIFLRWIEEGAIL
jgi:hypothetical protein